MTQTDSVKARLEAQLAELVARAEAIEDDLRHPLDADSSEQAVDLADDDALAGTDEVLRREILEARQALARIEAGGYGLCAACGAEIDPRRLEAMPTATRCIACA